MRRSEDLDLGPYTLGAFKRFYAALQSICAIHDFLCFLWGKPSSTYPIESAVQVKKRDEWIELLSFHSELAKTTTEQLLNDLTFHSKRLPDLHVFPFVPLDEPRGRWCWHRNSFSALRRRIIYFALVPICAKAHTVG